MAALPMFFHREKEFVLHALLGMEVPPALSSAPSSGSHMQCLSPGRPRPGSRAPRAVAW